MLLRHELSVATALVRRLVNHTAATSWDSFSPGRSLAERQAARPATASAECLPGALAAPVHPAVGPAPAAGPKTLEEVLQMKSKMEFAAQSLEFVMVDVVADAQEVAKGSPFGKGGEKEFTIKVLGDDLMGDGITRNQTVRDFKKEGTLGEILTEIVVTANSRKPPDDPDQKLIWVIAADPENPAKQLVLITTKAAAAKKKYNVPAVFLPKGQPK